MKRNYLFFAIGAIAVLTACRDDYDTGRIEKIYDTVPFDRIRLETASDIKIIQADHYQVIVEGRRNDVNDTEVRVENDRLVVEEHGHIDDDHVIRIFLPVIRHLESTGSSWVYGESYFTQSSDILITNTGSGAVDLYVDTDNLDVELTGSGTVILEGLSDNADYFLTGSGSINAFKLNTDFADIRITGSGSAELWVDTDLDAILTGSGDVYYKGHPTITSVITGTGRVIDAN